MGLGPKNLWFATALTVSLVAPEALGFGSKFDKRFRVNHSESFGGGKGSDFSDYSTLKKSSPAPKNDKEPSTELIIQNSSFPVRLVVGDIEQTASGHIPMAAMDPGGIQRRFKVDGCVLVVSTGLVAMTVFNHNEEGVYQPSNDSVYAHSAFSLEVQQKIVFAASADVSVRVLESTYAECASRFAGRRVYLGDIGFRDVSIFAINNLERVEGASVDESPVTPVYLEWSDATRKPKLETDSGYSVMIETGRMSLATNKGEFYVGMRLPWRMLLKSRP